MNDIFPAVFFLGGGILVIPALLGTVLKILFHHRQTPVPLWRGVVFHSTTRSFGRGISTCSENTFSRVLDLLAQRNAFGLGVTEAAAMIQTGVFPDNSTQRPYVILTFDDGFADFFETALPILQESGLKATIFPVAGFLGTRAAWDVFRAAHHLSASQIRTIADEGHEIGSHTLSHARLPWLPVQEIRRELRESKAVLEDVSGMPVTALSFPCGNWNATIWNIALEEGYRAATVIRGNPIDGRILPVMGVYRFDTAEDIMTKMDPSRRSSHAAVRATLLSHFSKGADLWKFRHEYHLFHHHTTR